jgi:pimeloyl-ACP methyl ester carboxylesterase
MAHATTAPDDRDDAPDDRDDAPDGRDDTPDGRGDAPGSGHPSETRTTTTADGHAVAYRRLGDPDGTPTLFLHGTPGSSHLAELLAEAASREGVQVLAPDRPGYGGSDPLPDRSLADTPAFVRPVLDDAGVDAVRVVAFSGGAPHALAFAARCPDRVTDVHLVAGATPPHLTADAPIQQRLLDVLAARTPRLLGGVLGLQAAVAARRSPSFVTALYTADDAAAVPDDVAAVVRRDFLAATRDQRAGVVRELALLADDWGFSLDDVTVPVALHHGTDDGNVPLAAARRLADRLPDATLHEVPDADHLRTLLRTRQTVLTAPASGPSAE